MAKLRSDSWASALSEEDAWKVFAHCRTKSFADAVAWIRAELAVEELPSRSAWYRWLDRMRSEDAAQRVARAAASVHEATRLAQGAGTSDVAMIEAYKTLAADAAMTTGDSKTAERYVAIAMSIADRARVTEELNLKRRAQATKDEALKLAREKFEAAEARLNATAEVVNDVAISDEERIARIKKIMGLK